MEEMFRFPLELHLKELQTTAQKEELYKRGYYYTNKFLKNEVQNLTP